MISSRLLSIIFKFSISSFPCSELLLSPGCKENLSIYLLKFSFLNKSYTFSLSHSSTLKSSKVSVIGTSKLIVPKVFDKNAKSLFCSIFSFCFPFKSSSPFSNLSYKFSIEPYFWINDKAVFSPTPGTPGILSDESPCNPFTSINCFGSKPYFSIIFSRLYSSVSVFPPFVCGILIVILSVASWKVSLSPESIVTSNPCFSPYLDNVPKTSSAS